nr:Holliday junction branch migration protein RuvA [Hyphomonadaceae bacterium]
LGRMRTGEAAHVFIETQVREDSFKLYGFASDQERAWFARLQDVGGVGARVALAILDVLSPQDLLEALALGDAASIARASGVGPKLAARIIVELKGKAPPAPLFGVAIAPVNSASANTTAPEPAPDEGNHAARSEAVSALINLGIGQSEALRAVAAAARGLDRDAPLSALVKAALKEAAPKDTRV